MYDMNDYSVPPAWRLDVSEDDIKISPKDSRLVKIIILLGIPIWCIFLASIFNLWIFVVVGVIATGLAFFLNAWHLNIECEKGALFSWAKRDSIFKLPRVNHVFPNDRVVGFKVLTGYKSFGGETYWVSELYLVVNEDNGSEANHFIVGSTVSQYIDHLANELCEITLKPISVGTIGDRR